MSDEGRLHDPRIPPIGSVPQAERMFRVNWIAAELRSPRGVPLLSPDFVAGLGRGARVVDLRSAEELVGPLGHIPGSDWVPLEGAVERLATLPKDEPVALVSRGGERAAEVALRLESLGHRFVAAVMGGVVAWRHLGLGTVRDAGILDRAGVLPPLRPTWEASKRRLTREDIAAHVGDPRSLRRLKAAALLVSGRLCCVDGRAEAGVVGTAGGDAGEFLLALAALESQRGERLDDAAVRALMLRRLDAFGPMYLHTDVVASNALIGALRGDRRLDAALARVYEPLEWRRFLGAPPADVREAILEHVLVPGHLGCGHLRLAMQRPDDYGVRPELGRAFLRAFFTLRWEGVEGHEVGILPGGHAEGAVVSVLLEEGVEAFSHVPLVSPMAEGSQMFLQHPQVAGFLRGNLARLIARGEADALRAAMDDLAARQLGHTLGALAPGLPIYDAIFCGDGSVRVESRGEVPA